jgi:hypothetical protein
MAGDPLDLFLDAITNALGVVMFILLMVVLFGRAGTAEPKEPSRDAERRRLEEAAIELAAAIEALPPAGDPELDRRWSEAMATIRRLEQSTVEVRRDTRALESKAEAQKSALAKDRSELEAIVEAKQAAERDAATSGFIRVSRLHDDARAPAILAVNGGRVTRVRPQRGAKEIRPPLGGIEVKDAAAARAAATELLADAPPGSHRVELLVWQGSFAAAKMLEAALLDLGYDTNPMAKPEGVPFGEGTSGVQ